MIDEEWKILCFSNERKKYILKLNSDIWCIIQLFVIASSQIHKCLQWNRLEPGEWLGKCIKALICGNTSFIGHGQSITTSRDSELVCSFTDFRTSLLLSGFLRQSPLSGYGAVRCGVVCVCAHIDSLMYKEFAFAASEVCQWKSCWVVWWLMNL